MRFKNISSVKLSDDSAWTVSEGIDAKIVYSNFDRFDSIEIVGLLFK